MSHIIDIPRSKNEGTERLLFAIFPRISFSISRSTAFTPCSRTRSAQAGSPNSNRSSLRRFASCTFFNTSDRFFVNRATSFPHSGPMTVLNFRFRAADSPAEAPPVENAMHRCPYLNVAPSITFPAAGGAAQFEKIPRFCAPSQISRLTSGLSVAANTIRFPRKSSNRNGRSRIFSRSLRRDSPINGGEHCGATSVTTAPAFKRSRVLRSATAPPPATSTATPRRFKKAGYSGASSSRAGRVRFLFGRMAGFIVSRVALNLPYSRTTSQSASFRRLIRYHG